MGLIDKFLDTDKEKLDLTPEIKETFSSLTEHCRLHADKRGVYICDRSDDGINPAVSVYAKNLPCAWELAMLACWDHGARVGTHYDPTSDTPKSKEGTITIKVENPFNEPRIHKNFPGGPEEMEIYRQEVVNGIHDHWINPKEKKWTYTYHERLTNYNPSIDLNAEDRGLLLKKPLPWIKKALELIPGVRFDRAPESGINQMEKIIDDLQRDITSKGAQSTTWMPTADPGLESNRPCLQRLWFRPLQIDPEDESKGYLLNLNSHWRSRDLAKAWFMNAYAITDWQRDMANRLQKRIQKPVKIGSYTDISDSLHIYGAYFDETKAEFEKMRDDDIKNRVWNSDHPAFTMMTEEAKEKLAEDADFQLKKRKL